MWGAKYLNERVSSAISSAQGDLLLALNDLLDKSSIGSKRSRARGAPPSLFTGLIWPRVAAPPAPIGGFPIASCRLKKLASQA